MRLVRLVEEKERGCDRMVDRVVADRIDFYKATCKYCGQLYDDIHTLNDHKTFYHMLQTPLRSDDQI
jgi:hypothetical protein